MVTYISPRKFADKWGVGINTVRRALYEGRIAGAVRQGNVWRIPDNATIEQRVKGQPLGTYLSIGGVPTEVATAILKKGTLAVLEGRAASVDEWLVSQIVTRILRQKPR